jgi:adenylate cyclase
MNTTAGIRKKILYDYIEPGSLAGELEENPLFTRRIDRLRRENVTGIFIITPRVSDSYAYLRLVREFERLGFPVRSIYINELTGDLCHYIDRAVEDIVSQFRKGSCMIVSYGSEYAAAMIAGIFISAGKSVDEAVGRVEAISDTLRMSEEEKKFLGTYRRYLFGSGKAAPANTAPARGPSGESTGRRKITADKFYGPGAETGPSVPVTSSRDEDHFISGEGDGQDAPVSGQDRSASESGALEAAPPSSALSRAPVTQTGETVPADIRAAGAQAGRKFYTSLKFKLISIISVVIVISLSGMIFLATYYFKSDNRIRVQQSNLDIAKILALKVKSDFITLIDNSKAITNDYLDPRGARGAELITSRDRNFLFYGVATGTPGGESLSFTSAVFNQELMDELQVTKENIENVGRLHGKNISRSLNGEIVVDNVSESLRVPVVGISYPLRVKGRDAIGSIVVNYVRFDRILLAFKAEDRLGQVFMVNDRGDVIAHQDGANVLNARNYINLPIVKAMIKSPQSNGQIRYKDENGTFFLGSFWKIGLGGCGVISAVEEDLALQQVYDMQRRNFYLMVIVLTIVIMIVFFFGTTITTPIIRLVEATKRIKDGQYRVDISASGKDEIGELTSAFVEMGIGLEEREKMKVAFGKFVNKEVAEQVLRGELRLGGERKNAAILFSDIRNFTSISEKLEPEEVVEFLNEYMTRMVNCINTTSGVVDKFIGDAIMAIWGAPVSHGNDVENAVNAALMMRSELIIFNRDRGGPRKPVIHIGCGINAGPVLAGQIGSEDRMEYTVIGDAVNLASRIESLNKPFGTDILVSQDAYDRVRDIFLVEPMQKIKVKGKAEAQQIFAVLGKSGDPGSPRTIQDLRALLGIEMEGKPAGEAKEEVKYEILEQ